MYAIKDNKCHEDITRRTPLILPIEDFIGFDIPSTQPLYNIIMSMRSNLNTDFLVYSVSNVTDTSIYPVKVPKNDRATVIINLIPVYSSTYHGVIQFHFYDSYYTNYFSNGNLAGWREVGDVTGVHDELNNILDELNSQLSLIRSNQDLISVLNSKINSVQQSVTELTTRINTLTTRISNLETRVSVLENK